MYSNTRNNINKIKGATRRGLRGLKPPLLSQVKVEIKDKKFQILADFVHTIRLKCYCNTLIPSQLSNFVAFELEKELFL